MKATVKQTTTFVLIILFFVACFIGMTVIFFGSWLYTYKALTRETQIAEVKISEQKKDEKGPYVDIELTPIEVNKPALTSIFVGNENNNPETLETQKFKFYGDTVYFGGPIIEFKDWMKLLNLDTVYKFNLVFGQYASNIELETKRTPDMASIKEIGDGDTRWRDIADEMRNGGVGAFFYNMFFQSEPKGSYTSIFVTKTPVTGKLFINNKGFDWRQD